MDDVTTALRLGWSVAEARGRAWPDGPQPARSTALPPPEELLPLRSQRDASESLPEALATLLAMAGALHLERAGEPVRGLEGAERTAASWATYGQRFKAADAVIQAELTERDDRLANAYLLGRGLAECFWGLGPVEHWQQGAVVTGVAPAYLFGDVRLPELTRMLGRLESAEVKPLSISAIDGSLSAWASVVQEDWTKRYDVLADALYAQARVWYQLLVLGQDPTTLIRPGQRLGGFDYLRRTFRAFGGQAVSALVALAFSVAVLALPGHGAVQNLLATGGLGAVALVGLAAKGKSAAQQLLTRIHLDAYTDLVSLAVTEVPSREPGTSRRPLVDLVRMRRLTPPTPAPATT